MNPVGPFQLGIFCDSMRLLQGTGKGTGKISSPTCLILCSCCAEKKSAAGCCYGVASCFAFHIDLPGQMSPV